MPPSAPRLCLVALSLFFSYALARPATESLFLEHWTSDGLPWAWAAVAIGALAVVAVYNRFAARVPLSRLYGWVAGISILTLGLLLALMELAPRPLSLLLYVWKDVHIVVLVEIFWSYASARFDLRSARWLYGVFCACGSIGGITGNLLGGELALRGGLLLPLWVMPLGLLISAGVAWGLEDPQGGEPSPSVRGPGLSGGWLVLRESKVLISLLLLIGTVQIVINLVDYTTSQALESTWPEAAERAAVISKLYAAIDVSSFALQLLTGPILLALGLRGTLLGIPALLGAALSAKLVLPGFGPLAVAKVASKALDYSLFRAAKEALYLPLSYAEKTQGKAWVDMLTYRVAKGAASLIVLLLVGLGSSALGLPLTLAGVAVWFPLAWKAEAYSRSRRTPQVESRREA